MGELRRRLLEALGGGVLEAGFSERSLQDTSETRDPNLVLNSQAEECRLPWESTDSADALYEAESPPFERRRFSDAVSSFCLIHPAILSALHLESLFLEGTSTEALWECTRHSDCTQRKHGKTRRAKEAATATERAAASRDDACAAGFTATETSSSSSSSSASVPASSAAASSSAAAEGFCAFCVFVEQKVGADGLVGEAAPLLYSMMTQALLAASSFEEAEAGVLSIPGEVLPDLQETECRRLVCCFFRLALADKWLVRRTVEELVSRKENLHRNASCSLGLLASAADVAGEARPLFGFLKKAEAERLARQAENAAATARSSIEAFLASAESSLDARETRSSLSSLAAEDEEAFISAAEAEAKADAAEAIAAFGESVPSRLSQVVLQDLQDFSSETGERCFQTAVVGAGSLKRLRLHSLRLESFCLFPFQRGRRLPWQPPRGRSNFRPPPLRC